MHNTHLKLTDLQSHGCMVYQAETHPIAIFAHAGKVFAVDNRCPHMGFPLAQGSVKDGILTCHWHHARFDLASGGAFDLFADDVRAFPTEVRDDEIWLDLTPLSPEAQRAHQHRRLQHGLERDLNLVIAKAVIALMNVRSGDFSRPNGETTKAVTTAREPFAIGLDFGARNRQQGWAMGQTIHVAMMNLLPFLDAEDQARALYHGLSAVARDCDGAPARHAIEPLPVSSLAKGLEPSQGSIQLKQWFRRFVEVRDEEGAERCIVTATQLGATPAQMTDMLMSAATDHRYMQIGHTADFSNKAIEAWQQIDPKGFENPSGLILASLAPSFADASRAEESNAWRNPIDLVEILENAFEQLPMVLTEGARRRVSLSIHTSDQLTRLADTILSDNPHDSAAAMLDALRHGMTTEQLAGSVCYAAALRMARFHTSNEFGDWDTVLHTFTFANAIHQAVRRAPSIELLRGVFDAAMSIYLDRFLNMPTAKIPQPEKTSAKPDDLLDEFLSLLNRQQQVNEAALLCTQYLANGGEPERWMATMGKALLREDPDFHTIQTIEAAFAQHQLWQGTPQADHFLIAAARYLAAHSPTPRAMEQTFRIAWRLHRGDRLFEED
jgi:nitrite reductase/ring-hydroxylating ferredoxin subunit